MLIHVLNISFIDMLLHIILIRLIMFHSISSHSNDMLLISCHAIYIFLSLILCFMPANTLEVDTGKKCMYPKLLSLYETVISICMTKTGLL